MFHVSVQPNRKIHFLFSRQFLETEKIYMYVIASTNIPDANYLSVTMAWHREGIQRTTIEMYPTLHNRNVTNASTVIRFVKASWLIYRNIKWDCTQERSCCNVVIATNVLVQLEIFRNTNWHTLGKNRLNARYASSGRKCKTTSVNTYRRKAFSVQHLQQVLSVTQMISRNRLKIHSKTNPLRYK